MGTKSLYEVQTYNDSAASGNRMHKDETARKYGFEGALVPSVTVFGHLCYLPVKDEGEAWMTNNRAEVRFISPTYDGDILTIEHDSQEGGGETLCLAADKKVIARMQHEHGASFSFNEALDLPPATEAPARVPISWHAIGLHEPAPAFEFEAAAATNQKLTRLIGDDLKLYKTAGAPVHPFWLLRECDAALLRSFDLSAWIHVGSTITWHTPIRTGDSVEVRMVPTAKWDKKGHEFATLYIAFLVDGDVRVEVEHTSIYKIATAAASTG